MLRRLLLATLTLGVILVAYGTYMYRSRDAAATKPQVNLPELRVNASAPASQGIIIGSEGVVLSPGQGAFYRVWDPVTQESLYTFQAREWEPISANEFRLVEPVITRTMSDGWEVRIGSGSGEITAEQVSKNQLKPKRGWLRDGVAITLDLTTRQWRAAHRDLAAADKHPDQIVRIEMDTLYFDDDLALVRTDGPVSLRTARAGVTTRQGMKLTYNKTGDRLEQLLMPGGGTISLRGEFDLGQRPAGSPAKATSSARQGPGAARRIKAAATATASAPPTEQAPRRPNVYQAVFQGPVEVRQQRDGEITASLDADKLLELVFDLEQQDRKAVGLAEDSAETMRAAAEPAGDRAESVLTVTWAGPLEVLPIEPPPTWQPQRAALVHAAGHKVALRDQANTITCTDLTYETASGSGRIRSESDEPAMIADQDGRLLAGRDIRFDRTANVLEVAGPGRAVDPGGEGWRSGWTSARGGADSTQISWSQHMLVRFRARPDAIATALPLHWSERIDPLPRGGLLGSGVKARPRSRATPLGANPMEGLIAESAALAGEVTIRTADESIAAQELAIEFLPRQGQDKFFGPPARAQGRGGVELTGRDRRITADQLDVTFTQGGPNRSVPARAIARGRAAAVQGDATIEADWIDAVLAEAPGPPEADAARPADDQPAGPKRLAVRYVEAGGDVRITDKDYILSAPSVQADLPTQEITVPAAGTLQLLVRQGLEGSKLKKPQPLRITWADRMWIHGQRNQAVFQNDVSAITQDQATAVTADRLIVYFRTMPQAVERQPPTAVAALLDQAREQLAEGLPGAANWLQIGPRRRRDGGPLLAETSSREPVLVIADGNAKALSSRYDSQYEILTSRLLVTGPSLTADLRRQQLEVRGKGNLLIEDYSLAKAAVRLAGAKNPATLPSVGAIDETGLSQTYFGWENAMTFVLPDQLAVFDGQVQMTYLSGSRIRLAAELATALAANLEHLRVLPGRKANLNCSNLVVQFREAAGAPPPDSQGDPWLQRARLENIRATGRVYLREESGSQGGSLMLIGDLVQYSGQRDTFAVQGSPARVFRQKDAQSPGETHQMPMFYYNRATGQIIMRDVRGQGIR